VHCVSRLCACHQEKDSAAEHAESKASREQEPVFRAPPIADGAHCSPPSLFITCPRRPSLSSTQPPPAHPHHPPQSSEQQPRHAGRRQGGDGVGCHVHGGRRHRVAPQHLHAQGARVAAQEDAGEGQEHMMRCAPDPATSLYLNECCAVMFVAFLSLSLSCCLTLVLLCSE